VKLVVGLGNPGREYARTRHNLGFEVVEKLAERHRFPDARVQMNALCARGSIGGAEVMLVRPQTYMNLSGDAVGALMRYLKIEPADVIVAHDELDFEPGLVRVKMGGGHGGNNGLRSIIGHIGREFARVRVGIGKPRGDGADWVLSRVDSHTRGLLDEAIERASDAVELILEAGVAQAMNEVNRREAGAPD
jgi:peptidyl-tRNA hydrolase, PTH1 family